MPCPANTPPQAKPKHVVDWASVHPYDTARDYQPATLDALVSAIMDGESLGGKMKAVGSNYSLSTAAVTDNFLIETSALRFQLSQPHRFPKVGAERWFDTSRMATPAHHADWLDKIVRRGLTLPPGSHLIHVQAGIAIKDLLTDLDSVGLALPTMGAGGGQTLAGALSTGTHGSDFNLPPLSDFVRAVHIVGPHGQEWWIQPGDGVIDTRLLQILPGWCPDAWIVRDDDWFRAAILTIGRFGVVYSMVLEVTEQYRLYESTNKEPLEPGDVQPRSWPEQRAQLLATVGGNDDGVFLRPIANEFGGNDVGEPLRFFSVLIDLALGQACWVTRRWRTTLSGDLGMDTGPGLDAILCAPSTFAVDIVAAATPVFVTLAGEAALTPGAGLVWSGAVYALQKELADMAAQSANVGDFLAQLFGKIHSLNTDLYGYVAPELKGLLTQLAVNLLNGAQTPDRRSSSHLILDTHDYKRDGCLSANSSEFFFDARDGAYLSFVDDVLKASDANGPVPGYIALRYIRGSQAHMAMERFPLTVAIEVAVGRSFTNDQFRPFMSVMRSIAKAHGGIPHWGQEHDITSQDVAAIYGPSLETWRWALAEHEAGGAPTFSNAFCVARGLETAKSLDEYRAARDGGVLASLIDVLSG